MFKRIASLIIGGVFNLALIFLAMTFIPSPEKYAVALIILGYFGIGGLISVPIANQGVMLFLGGRMPMNMPEGYSWLLPRPIMNIENVTAKEFSSNPGPIECITKNRVRVTVDATIQWAVDNAYKSLSVGMGVINEGMLALIQQVIRAHVAKKTDEEVIEMHEELKNQLEVEADKKSAEWGIDIRNIFLPTIQLQKEVMEDYEKIKREGSQRESERIELQHVREQINEFKKQGFTTERSGEMVQVAQGKVKKEIIERIFGLSGKIGDDIGDIGRIIAGKIGGNK